MNSISFLTRILSAKQIRAADQYTIENLPIASIDLMERASKVFVSWFLKNYGIRKNIKVFCGTGNNGGDGLAISRLLLEHGCEVNTFCVGDQKNGTPDFLTNLDRLELVLPPIWIDSKSTIPSMSNEDIVIDALFGSGLTRSIVGVFADVIHSINQSVVAAVLAVDIPSGLYCDQHSESEAIVRCTYTISFQIPKLTFYFPQNDEYVGGVQLVDIGLDESFIDEQKTNHFLINKKFIQSILKTRRKYTHKGVQGRNLIVSGSKGKMGAAVLATRACLRSGAGLVTSFVPASGNDIMQIAVPEAMTLADVGMDYITSRPDVEKYDAIGVGPGIGTDKQTANVIKEMLARSEKPCVLDADALNIIAENSLLELIPPGSILTPHPGEFERLVGEWKNDFHRLELQSNLSKTYGIVIVLKGAHTSITDASGNVYFNTTGNPGMATGGSGDVLTGIVTALLGQGYNSIHAAILAVYVHGVAGNLYAYEFSEEGLIAGDLADSLPKAFAKLR